MFKRLIIWLVAVGLVTIFVATAANAFYWRGRGAVDTHFTCPIDGLANCPASFRDRIVGAVEVSEASSEESCDYYWDSSSGKCYQPTCVMTGTLVCEYADDCGLIYNFPVTLIGESFKSQENFTEGEAGTAIGIGFLKNAETICSDSEYGGDYSDYSPNAGFGETSFFDGVDATGIEVKKQQDFFPNYAFSNTYQRNIFNTSVLWSSTGGSSIPEPLHFPCCGESNSLTVNVNGSGTVSISDPAGTTNCDDGTEPCVVPYDVDHAPVDQCPVVMLTAVPLVSGGEEWRFIRWEGACSGTEPSCEVTPGATTTVTAIFEAVSFTLTVKVYGDQNDVGWLFDPFKKKFDDPNETNCSHTCTVKLDANSTYSVKKKGGSLVPGGWGGDDCFGIPNSSDYCSGVMDGNKEVTITFVP